MSAAHFTLGWDDTFQAGPVPLALLDSPSAPLTRTIAPARPSGRCPACDSIIYSRRHPLCGVCGAPLPRHLLFSEGDAVRVEALLRAEQRRHRAWLQQRETQLSR